MVYFEFSDVGVTTDYAFCAQVKDGCHSEALLVAFVVCVLVLFFLFRRERQGSDSKSLLVGINIYGLRYPYLSRLYIYKQLNRIYYETERGY